MISRSNWKRVVWPLPVGAMLYAGPAAQRALGQYGVRTIGDLAALDAGLPEQLLGKLGRQLWEYANGLDLSPVRPQHEKEPVKIFLERNFVRKPCLSHSIHLTRELLETAMELVDKVWKPPAPVRLLNVTALALTDGLGTYEQADLFAPQRSVENEKHERLEQVMDAIRRKYSGGSISYGGVSGREEN